MARSSQPPSPSPSPRSRRLSRRRESEDPLRCRVGTAGDRGVVDAAAQRGGGRVRRSRLGNGNGMPGPPLPTTPQVVGSGTTPTEAQQSTSTDPRVLTLLEAIQAEQQRNGRFLEAIRAEQKRQARVLEEMLARYDQFQLQMVQAMQNNMALHQHLLQHIRVPPFVWPVQQVPLAPLQTPVGIAVQSGGIFGQGGLQQQQQFVSPIPPFSLGLTTPGLGMAQGFAGLSAPACVSQSLAASFRHVTGEPSPPMTATAFVIAPAAPEIDTTATVHSSVSSSEQPVLPASQPPPPHSNSIVEAVVPAISKGQPSASEPPVIETHKIETTADKDVELGTRQFQLAQHSPQSDSSVSTPHVDL